MLLKGGLHTHTDCSDGDLSVLETVEVYSDLGYDFIALTDHDYLLSGDCYDCIMEIKTDLIIFTGEELTVFEKGNIHVSRIFGDHEVLHIFNHPSELFLPVEKVIERIRAVAEHYPLDAVEITSFGFSTPEYDIPEIPYPKVATDDSHTRLGCGRAWIELECMRDKDSIIHAVRNGDFRNGFAEPGSFTGG